MKPLKLYCNIKDGVFEFLSPEWVNGKLNELPNGEYFFTLNKANKRSSQSNRYLHGVVFPVVFEALRDAGFDCVKDVYDAKEVCKSLFLKEKVVNHETGEVITEIIKHTSDLTQEEMVQFIEDISMWAASYLSCEIPEPNSQSKLFAT